MTKKERLQQLVDIFSSGPYKKSDLIGKLGISERTLWRDKKDLEKQGYNIHVTGDIWKLSQGQDPSFKDAKAKLSDVRRMAILRLVASGCQIEDLRTKICDRFDCTESTVTKDLMGMLKQGYLAKDGGKLILGEAMLEELDLTVEEGSRLLSYLIVRQEIEGKNPLYNSLVLSLIGALGKNSWCSWQEAKQTTQKILIKGKCVEQEMRERAMAERLELASWEEQIVELVYRGEKRQVEPLGVIYSYHQDAWYLHAFCRKANARRTFRLELIQEFSVLDEKFTYPKEFDLKDNFASSWGIMVDEPPTYVRIKFYGHFNVQSRLRREVAKREQAKITPMEDGSILFEDWVVGLEEIKVWVRSFGFSAEILEPEELRKSLIESVKIALSRYGEEVD